MVVGREPVRAEFLRAQRVIESLVLEGNTGLEIADQIEVSGVSQCVVEVGCVDEDLVIVEMNQMNGRRIQSEERRLRRTEEIFRVVGLVREVQQCTWLKV